MKWKKKYFNVRQNVIIPCSRPIRNFIDINNAKRSPLNSSTIGNILWSECDDGISFKWKFSSISILCPNLY